MEPIGLYLHIPFCVSKCGYCDFFSAPATEETIDAYAAALCRSLDRWGKRLMRPADTLYFGGGTPSLLGGTRIAAILEAAKAAFGLEEAEITLEANPGDDLAGTLKAAARAGVNRVSLGVQSGVDSELAALTRRHSADDAVQAVKAARAAGIENLSLDLMLGIPGQTEESLEKSLDFLTALEPEHISAYLLKIEAGTPFERERPAVADEDLSADLYLAAVGYLTDRGYRQYEISNFAKLGYKSRHNLKYWNCDEYLGLGPSAHSFLNGKRFFYEKNLTAFFLGAPPSDDGTGGDPEEYAMLRFRLSEGLVFHQFEERFGRPVRETVREKAKKLAEQGLVSADEFHVALTSKGFLVSNQVLFQLLVGGV